MLARKLLGLTLLLFLFCGCGGGMPATVSGKVTLDGQPLPTGNVAFHPVAGGPIAVGSIQSSGVYQVNTGTSAGLAPGEYQVTVLATKDLPAEIPGQAPLPPEPITPAKYHNKETSGFQFTIKPGGNMIDLPLKST